MKDMNIVDFIVLGAIAAIFVMSIMYLARRIKRNGGTCGCCENCAQNCADRNPDVAR